MKILMMGAALAVILPTFGWAESSREALVRRAVEAGSSRAQAARVADAGAKMGADSEQAAMDKYIELLNEGLEESSAARAALGMTRATNARRGAVERGREEEEHARRRELNRVERQERGRDERRLRRDGPGQPVEGRPRR